MSTGERHGAAVYFLLALIALGLLVLIGPLRNLTATTSTSRATVWVYTPHVAPGDALAMEVQIRGGRRLGIQQIKVYAGASYLQKHGRGKHWGAYITGRGSARGSDSAELSIPIPRDAVVGETLPVSIEVEYVQAVAKGGGTFENHADSEVFALDVHVRSPHDRDVRRALSALWALGLVLAASGAVWLIRAWMRSSSSNARLVVWVVLFPVGAYLGYGWFALPLVAATGILSDVFAVVAVVVFLAVPIVVLRLLGRRGAALFHSARFETITPPTPPPTGEAVVRAIDATDYPERMTRDVPLATLVDAIGAELPLRRRRRGFVWIDRERSGRLDVTVADPAYVKARSLKVRTTDRRMVLPVAEALVRVYGPIEIIFNENQRVLVDGSMSAGELLLVLDPRWSAVEAMADRMLGRRRKAALPKAQVRSG